MAGKKLRLPPLHIRTAFYAHHPLPNDLKPGDHTKKLKPIKHGISGPITIVVFLTPTATRSNGGDIGLILGIHQRHRIDGAEGSEKS